ncbi:MAG: hypothetical protein HC883_02865 [Bdellovibrionaceae bacterium]|nr:hypothetical protein [Pseudobdellovibrionaceae bacterium]
MKFIRFNSNKFFQIEAHQIRNLNPDETVIWDTICDQNFLFSLRDVLRHLQGTVDWSQNGRHSVYNNVPGGVTSWLRQIDADTRQNLNAQIEAASNTPEFRVSHPFGVGEILVHPNMARNLDRHIAGGSMSTSRPMAAFEN